MDQTNKKKSLLFFTDESFYKKHGKEVTKINVVYHFRQPEWLAKNLRNADQRTKAQIKVEKKYTN